MTTSSTHLIAGWLRKLSQGEKSNLESLLGHVQNRFRRIARHAKARLPGDQQDLYDTDDLLQDMQVRLISRWESVLSTLRDVPDSDRVRFFFGCAARIIRDLVCEQARRNVHRQSKVSMLPRANEPGIEHDENSKALPVPLDHSNVPERIAMWAEFHEFMNGLPDPLRQVSDLYWYNGLTHTEVGAVLGIAEVTSRSRWAQVRHQILLKFPETPFSWQNS